MSLLHARRLVAVERALQRSCTPWTKAYWHGVKVHLVEKTVHEDRSTCTL